MIEYDERNSFLHTITISYNRRMANKNLVFTAEVEFLETYVVIAYDALGITV